MALHLGHRQSRDLDFFSQEPMETLLLGPTLDQLSPVFTQTALVDQQIDQTHWIGTEFKSPIWPILFRGLLLLRSGRT